MGWMTWQVQEPSGSVIFVSAGEREEGRVERHAGAGIEDRVDFVSHREVVFEDSVLELLG